MSSDNPSGADNQQGSRDSSSKEPSLTPQRLHAELLAAGAMDLEAYLQGALHDGTRSALHRTHRIGQSEEAWIDLLGAILAQLGYRSWKYQEGRTRRYWVLETTASFLSLDFDPAPFVGRTEGLHYVRGYFDAEGGMPKGLTARLYFQLCQKDLVGLGTVREILQSWQIDCGRIHNPSAAVDPDYWRFYVRARSHRRFMALVGSWHPRKRRQVEARMKI